jgi:hypothetical protein
MALSVGSLFTLIVILLALGLLVWLAFYVLAQFTVPEPLNKLIRVVVVVFAVLILVSILLGLAGVGPGVRIVG